MTLEAVYLLNKISSIWKAFAPKGVQIGLVEHITKCLISAASAIYYKSIKICFDLSLVKIARTGREMCLKRVWVRHQGFCILSRKLGLVYYPKYMQTLKPK